jgi:phenylalanyl-tRNA synthetase alpha chain
MDPNIIEQRELFYKGLLGQNWEQAKDLVLSTQAFDILWEKYQEAQVNAPKIGSLPKFEAFKAQLVGTNGALKVVSKTIGSFSPHDRPKAGQVINGFKQIFEKLISETLARLETAELTAQLGPAVDPTLPAPAAAGLLHPLTQARREVCALFRKVGFTLAEGPELETEWFNFDALNTPADHPARNEQDTFYLPDTTPVGNVTRHGSERYLLRSHTSTVQIRTLLKEKPPLRVLAPGRTFRRDNVDATHSANFHQVEGLCVDRRVTVVDLKAALDYLVRGLFGAGAQTRLRPSFFPFTEPSFELDFQSPDLGRLSGKWLELGGCGLVDPEVFKACNLDPAEWTGYAFGFGLERIAMVRAGIDDIRHFFQNDLRFLRQFA